MRHATYRPISPQGDAVSGVVAEPFRGARGRDALRPFDTGCTNIPHCRRATHRARRPQGWQVSRSLQLTVQPATIAAQPHAICAPLSLTLGQSPCCRLPTAPSRACRRHKWRCPMSCGRSSPEIRRILSWQIPLPVLRRSTEPAKWVVLFGLSEVPRPRPSAKTTARLLSLHSTLTTPPLSCAHKSPSLSYTLTKLQKV